MPFLICSFAGSTYLRSFPTSVFIEYTSRPLFFFTHVVPRVFQIHRISHAFVVPIVLLSGPSPVRHFFQLTFPDSRNFITSITGVIDRTIGNFKILFSSISFRSPSFLLYLSIYYFFILVSITIRDTYVSSVLLE